MVQFIPLDKSHTYKHVQCLVSTFHIRSFCDVRKRPLTTSAICNIKYFIQSSLKVFCRIILNTKIFQLKSSFFLQTSACVVQTGKKTRNTFRLLSTEPYPSRKSKYRQKSFPSSPHFSACGCHKEKGNLCQQQLKLLRGGSQRPAGAGLEAVCSTTVKYGDRLSSHSTLTTNCSSISLTVPLLLLYPTFLCKSFSKLSCKSGLTKFDTGK